MPFVMKYPARLNQITDGPISDNNITELVTVTANWNNMLVIELGCVVLERYARHPPNPSIPSHPIGDTFFGSQRTPHVGRKINLLFHLVQEQI